MCCIIGGLFLHHHVHDNTSGLLAHTSGILFLMPQSILNPSNLYQYFCLEAYAVVSNCISHHLNTAVEWMFIPPKNPVELPMEPGRNATNLAHERQSGVALGYFSLPNIL